MGSPLPEECPHLQHVLETVGLSSCLMLERQERCSSIPNVAWGCGCFCPRGFFGEIHFRRGVPGAEWHDVLWEMEASKLLDCRDSSSDSLKLKEFAPAPTT